MSETSRDLGLEMLRAIRSDIAEVKERPGALVARHASLSRRLDHVAAGLDQVRRRLGPIDA